jgi:hypothetical protein
MAPIDRPPLTASIHHIHYTFGRSSVGGSIEYRWYRNKRRHLVRVWRIDWTTEVSSSSRFVYLYQVFKSASETKIVHLDNIYYASGSKIKDLDNIICTDQEESKSIVFWFKRILGFPLTIMQYSRHHRYSYRSHFSNKCSKTSS